MVFVRKGDRLLVFSRECGGFTVCALRAFFSRVVLVGGGARLLCARGFKSQLIVQLTIMSKDILSINMLWVAPGVGVGE